MATPYQGGAALGDILFGGRDRGNSDVFLKRLRENYSTQKAMEDASTAQIQRIARESQTAETVAKATGLPLGQAAMIANALQSQDSMNLNTAGVTPLQMQEYGLKNRAVDSLAPELGMGNAALAAIDGKPLKRNAIDSGYQLDPYAVGGDATPTETENARIGELGARADVSRAKAAAGGFAPPRGGRGGSSDGGDVSAQVEFIIAEGERLAKTRGREWAAAWAKKEAAKIGIPELNLTGEFGTKDKPATKYDGMAPQGVDQGEYDKATKKKADALDAIRRGAPKDKVAARLKEQGYPKLAELVMGAR